MSLSYLNIDYENVEKIQAVLDKHGIKYNYKKNIIDKIQKYSNKNKGLINAIDDYDLIDKNNNMYSITLKYCQKWLKDLKKVGFIVFNTCDDIIYIRNGAISIVCLFEPVKKAIDTQYIGLNHILTEKEIPFGKEKQVGSIEELDKALEINDKIIQEYVNFLKNPNLTKYLELYKENVEKCKKELEICESTEKKITKGIIKILEIENENCD